MYVVLYSKRRENMARQTADKQQAIRLREIEKAKTQAAKDAEKAKAANQKEQARLPPYHHSKVGGNFATNLAITI
jgi:hypothetical protein